MAKIWYYLNLAGKTATKNGKSHKKRYHLGAVAIRKDGAVVVSQNGATKQPNQEVHAEAKVLRKAGTDALLFVARVGRDGRTKMARPCPRCLTEIKNRRVKKVYYTINSQEYGCIQP